jgi:phospholipid transport system substrate-binding protein
VESFDFTGNSRMSSLEIDRRRLLLLASAAGMAAMPWSARAASDPAVIAPIQRLCETLIQIMKMGASTPFEQRYNVLEPVVEDVFDLGLILQLSVGPTWGTLSPDQTSTLATAFQRYTVASYVNSFDSFTGQRFDVSPDTRTLPDGDQIAQTKIVSRSGDSNKLDYVMRHREQSWKAVDVLEDGTISRVAVQRSDFRHLLLSGGAAGLLASLQRKTTELSGGA